MFTSLSASRGLEGRVWTHHKPDGSHFELGAFSFADSEKTLWKIIDQHGLEAIPHSSINREFIFEDMRGYFSDRISSLMEGAPELTFSELLQSYLEKIPEQEDVSFEQALVKSGASEKVIRWLEIHTLPGLLGEGFASLSTQGTLQYFRQYLGSKKFYAVKGGNDQIPIALAKELGERIHCHFPITKIERCAIGWIMHGKGGLVSAKQIIFAVPVPALQQIAIHPPLSDKKQEAMAKIRYTSCTRISVTAPSRHLGEARGGVFAISGGWFRDQTLFQMTPRTVFNQSFVGEESRQIRQMEPQEWQKYLLANLKKFVPEFRDDSIELDVHSWDDVEWIRGGYSYFSPQEFRFKEELANQEGSLFFCGEHTSDKPASMNGALESGIRAALEVLVARKSNVIETKEIIPIRSILEVESYFLSSGKTLAAFDIDDTLTILRDPAFQRPNFKVHHAGVFDEIMSSLSVEEKILAFTLPLLTTSSDLIEQETKELFARMQRRENTKAVAITAAMGGKIEEVAIEDRRIDELQRVGIDFSPYFPDIISEIVFPEFSNPMMGRSPFFKKGVILANEHDKGDVLVHFLKNISWIPDQLIIVDDREEHLHAVKRAIRSYNPHIDVIALHYQAVPNAYKAADVEHFKKQWMQMGEQAKKILEKMTAAAKYLNK